MDLEAILVTGGAGYIGSHAVLALLDSGYKVVVLDDLSTGTKEALFPEATFYKGNVGDVDFVAHIIKSHSIKAVMHFAGSIVVPESVKDPLKYYQNNAVNSCQLIKACVQNGIRTFIFSSTAAVYGQPDPKLIPLKESTPLNPINPYGWSKRMTEQMLIDVGAAYPDFRYAALRYFNVAGADPQGRAGQRSPDATHLIKVACQAATGQRPSMDIYGHDYPTKDGTCIRDYIHVTDLARAHVQALDYLLNGGDSLIANCGYGHGFSVKEVIAVVKELSGVDFPVHIKERRLGDPPALVADPTFLRAHIGWKPEFDNLRTIITHALAWERKLVTEQQTRLGTIFTGLNRGLS